MKVSKAQFGILSLLTLCAILWLLCLTCYREYWGFWQSPEDYRWLIKEYPLWCRQYIWDYYGATFGFTVLLYIGWLGVCFRKMSVSRSILPLLIGMTLMMGIVLGVICTNNLIGLLDSGKLHGKSFLPVEVPR